MTDPRTYRALLVANSTFPDDTNLLDLEGPRNDPALLRDALADETVGLVPSDNIRLVTERTMSEVLRELETFLAAGSRDDTLIMYYSGHGVLDQRSELFLCTRDTNTQFLKSTSVKASDIREMIDDSAAATTVIFLDCCHSGRFKGGDALSNLAGRGTFIVTSSRPGELANDTDVLNRASLFTHYLVQGIRSGATDADGDGIVTLTDVYDYLFKSLAADGRHPVPQKRFEGDGHVALAKRSQTATASHDELLDPAHAEPILDIPVPRIDLGDVDADVKLPPERIAVINRGGGTLEWTFDTECDWVRPERRGNELVLHLSPPPGTHLANIYVKDTHLGTVKTVRVSVNVRARRTTDHDPPGPTEQERRPDDARSAGDRDGGTTRRPAWPGTSSPEPTEDVRTRRDRSTDHSDRPPTRPAGPPAPGPAPTDHEAGATSDTRTRPATRVALVAAALVVGAGAVAAVLAVNESGGTSPETPVDDGAVSEPDDPPSSATAPDESNVGAEPVISSGTATVPATIGLTADDGYDLYVNGQHVGASWMAAETFELAVIPGENVVGVRAATDAPQRGLAAKLVTPDGDQLVAPREWSALPGRAPGAGWNEPGAPEQGWSAAIPSETPPDGAVEGLTVDVSDWAWVGEDSDYAYFRLTFSVEDPDERYAITLTAAKAYTASLNGEGIGGAYVSFDSWPVELSAGENVIGVDALNLNVNGPGGVLVEVAGDDFWLSSNDEWRYSQDVALDPSEWSSTGFDDSRWRRTTSLGTHETAIAEYQGWTRVEPPSNSATEWIWIDDPSESSGESRVLMRNVVDVP